MVGGGGSAGIPLFPVMGAAGRQSTGDAPVLWMVGGFGDKAKLELFGFLSFKKRAVPTGGWCGCSGSLARFLPTAPAPRSPGWSDLPLPLEAPSPPAGRPLRTGLRFLCAAGVTPPPSRQQPWAPRKSERGPAHPRTGGEGSPRLPGRPRLRGIAENRRLLYKQQKKPFGKKRKRKTAASCLRRPRAPRRPGRRVRPGPARAAPRPRAARRAGAPGARPPPPPPCAAPASRSRPLRPAPARARPSR